MGNYSDYPKYKPSGVAWLGDVPEHWSQKRLKFVTKCLDAKRIPLNSSERAELSGDIPYWGANGILDYVDNFILNETLVLLGEDGAPFFDRYKPVAFVVSGPIWPNNHVHILRPLGINPSYLTYCLNITEFANYIDGSTRDKLVQSAMNEIPIIFPPLSEQESIARFLDRKTAQIDALIAKKDALLAKLAEKRTALISQAVTRGLDPTAPMKNSGIEWLGDIPVHWKVLPLKYAVTFQRGHDLPAEQRVEGDIPLVTSSGISARHDTAVAKGPGIVTGRYGTIGKFTLVEEDYWPLNTTLYSIRTYDNDVKFLWYMMHNLSALFILNSQKSAVPGVDRNDLHPVLTALPPVDEQKKIAKAIDKETCEIDKQVLKVEGVIARLREYRTALITAAVTGKIDVRSLPEASPPITPEMEAVYA